MKRCICGLDLGSSAVKAALVDEEGQILSQTSLAAPPLDASLQTFDALAYARKVFQALRRLMRTETGRVSRIEALSLSSQRSTTVLLDAHDKPLGPALSWQGIACADSAELLYKRLGTDRFLSITGLPPTPVYTVAKLAHLQATQIDRLAQAARIVTLHDWLLLLLGADQPLTDHSSASATGLYDLAEQTWSAEIMEHLGLVPTRFPLIVPAGSPAGVMSAGAANSTGMLQGTPLFVGGGDQQCAALGAGTSPGDCVLSLGTAGVMMAPMKSVPKSGLPGFLLMAHVLPGQFVLEGFINAFGSCAAWASEALRTRGGSGLEQLATTSVAHDEALFLPFLAGAGSPQQDHAARGAFLGLSLSTSRADMARAVFVGLACEVCRIVDAMRGALDIDRLTVVGGAGGNTMLPALLADIAGVPLAISRQKEAALLGAAALAWSGLRGNGRGHAVSAFVNHDLTIVMPTRDRRHFDAIYSRYRAAVAALNGFA